MNRRYATTCGAVLCLTLILATAHARKAQDRYTTYRAHQPVAGANVSDHEALNGLRATAVASTTILGQWDFEGPLCDPQSWVSVDITAPTGEYFHVEDFIGMGPNYRGDVGVLNGNQSLWCGARASNSPILCGYATLPGYGNSWDQRFRTKVCEDFGTSVTMDFLLDIDSEPGYDATTLEYTTCTGGQSDENWQVIAGGVSVWDGYGGFTDTIQSVSVPDTLPDGGNRGSIKLRFRFTSDGAWSDEDGLWDTDGGVAIDDLSVTGSLASLALEDFEGETTGATETEDWESGVPPGYGDFSSLYPGALILQEDPCVSNVTCVWGFFNGSTTNYACGGFPGQATVPVENVSGQYINNEIWSPLMPITGTGLEYELQFDAYRDLRIDPLVFFVFHVRSWVDGCPGRWRDRNFVYWGADKDWFTNVFPVGDLVEPGASDLQAAMGVVDMCPFWCGIFGNGACHSHAPLFDNVIVRRIDTDGPQWSGRDIDMFQDTFASDGTTTGTARIDMANDILPASNPNILPGDSAVIQVSQPADGLGLDGTGWAAVYLFAHAVNDTAPEYPPGAYTQDGFRFPVVGTQTIDGTDWVQIRCDTIFQDGAARQIPQTDRFCVDLNDNLFVPGDEIRFFFGAQDALGVWSYWNMSLGSTPDIATAAEFHDECTILPGSGALHNGGDILYVDGFNLRGAQPFFQDTWGALDQAGFGDQVDRYDVRGPSSNVGNRPGARVVDVFQQVVGVYRKIIWNTGDLDEGLIGDGTGYPEKSDDATMLFAFLDNLPNTGGIYFSGDNIAQEWETLSGAGAVALRSYITHDLVSSNHVDFGLPVSPLVIGLPPGPSSYFNDGFTPDRLIAFGGCPIINDFDVLEPTGTAIPQMLYENAGPYDPINPDAAIISQRTLNVAGFEVSVLLSGFSFHEIREDAPEGQPDRLTHMQRILSFLGNTPPEVLPVGPDAFANSLTQNYPNPFNPTTTIHFTVRERAPVTLRVYNVAGQLVRTLVNDTRAPGVSHTVTWDGNNNAGQSVSSGVYFYRLVSDEFTQTRKMVLLK